MSPSNGQAYSYKGNALIERRYRMPFGIDATRTLMRCSHFHSLTLAATGQPANRPGRPGPYRTVLYTMGSGW